MTVGLFFFGIIVLIACAGMVYILTWLPKNFYFSDNEKKQHMAEIAIKIARFVLVILTGVLSIQFLVVLLEPLFDYMGAAFDTAVSKLFNLLEKLIPWAVLGGIGWLWWKEKHPKAPAPVPATVTDADIELARQAAMDMQGYALSFMLRVLITISSFTSVIRPHETYDIEIRSTDGASFYMKGDVVIYQAEVEVEGEVTPEVEDTIQREVQRYAQKYITDYPMLISPEAGGRAPVEVLGVKNCGSRVLIDYVFTSAKSVDMINARRRARVERQMKQERPAPYTDPDYGE